MYDNIHAITLNNCYQIQKQLSHKAGRSTYIALDTRSDELVIIKILQFDRLFQWDDLKLFEREAKTLKNLNHPAIPKYLDYFEIDSDRIRGFALVQTYIDAPSLEDTIQQGRKFTEAELIELAQKLLTILDYLHSSNPLIHRDIKPSNILLSNRTGNSVGELYLIDFGSVQTAASKGEGTITIVGSYGYIPLEQFGGQTTTASDLYSLGMTLIYIITGVHPAELSQDNGRVKFDRSQISDGLQRWLVKMTEPYLDRRFNSAKSAQANLDRRFDLAKSAQANLLTKEDAVGFADLKPDNSKTILERDRRKLKIVFEREVLDYKSPQEDIGCLCLGLLVAVFIFLLQFPALIWFLYLLIICLWIKLFRESAFYNPSTTHYELISIDKNRSVKWANYSDKTQLLEQPKWQVVNFADRVNLIIYNPGYIFNNLTDGKGKIINSGKVKIPYQLSLHTNRGKYVIGNGRQSKAELFWLGKEISDFLGLELQVIYPTP